MAENPPQDHSKMEFGDKNNLETAQYLKNEIFPGYAVFARCSQTLCTIIFSQNKQARSGPAEENNIKQQNVKSQTSKNTKTPNIETSNIKRQTS